MNMASTDIANNTISNSLEPLVDIPNDTISNKLEPLGDILVFDLLTRKKPRRVKTINNQFTSEDPDPDYEYKQLLSFIYSNLKSDQSNQSNKSNKVKMREPIIHRSGE